MPQPSVATAVALPGSYWLCAGYGPRQITSNESAPVPDGLQALDGAEREQQKNVDHL
ncbi:MAG: hypothetical protein WCF33_03280 [Pseudonocardiaceae bacterium]